MSTQPSIFRQESAPPQKYEPIRFKRNLSTRGPGGRGLLLGAAAIMTYGWYRLTQGQQEKLELDREEAWMKIYLLPFLLAEEDRDIYRREMAQVAREREIMKDVEGWNERRPVYNTERYVRRSIWLGNE